MFANSFKPPEPATADERLAGPTFRGEDFSSAMKCIKDSPFFGDKSVFKLQWPGTPKKTGDSFENNPDPDDPGKNNGGSFLDAWEKLPNREQVVRDMLDVKSKGLNDANNLDIESEEVYFRAMKKLADAKFIEKETDLGNGAPNARG